MSNQSKRLRKTTVVQLRKEGREAYESGKNRQSCPHKYMDQFQWIQGFDAAESEGADLRYSIGVDWAQPSSSDESMVALVNLGCDGAPDELKTVLTWTEAKLIARAVTESEAP